MAETKKKFELQTWVDDRMQPLVRPLIGDTDGEWAKWRVAMLAGLMKDTAFGKGTLMRAVQGNPVSAQLSLVKCAQLGLSPDPSLEQFSLIPRSGVVEAHVDWRGWQHLMLSSGAVEWIHTDVIYKAEYDAMKKAGVPLRDRETNRLNIDQFIDEIGRDSFDDKDVVAAYCTVALKKQTRCVTVVLTRKELDARRAMAQTDKVWKAHYVKMCKKSTVKAMARLGQVPLSRKAAEALREDLALDDTDAAPVATPEAGAASIAVAPPAGAMSSAEPVDVEVEITPDSPPPPPEQSQGASDFLFDELNKDPLPDEATSRKQLLQAIEMEADRQDLSLDGPVLELAKTIVDGTIEGLENLDNDQLRELLDLVVNAKRDAEG